LSQNIWLNDWISETKFFLPMRNLWITIILDYRIPLLTLFQLYRDWGVLDTIICDKVCKRLVTGWSFSTGILVSSNQ
jgi:hypothetical protein